MNRGICTSSGCPEKAIFFIDNPKYQGVCQKHKEFKEKEYNEKYDLTLEALTSMQEKVKNRASEIKLEIREKIDKTTERLLKMIRDHQRSILKKVKIFSRRISKRVKDGYNVIKINPILESLKIESIIEEDFIKFSEDIKIFYKIQIVINIQPKFPEDLNKENKESPSIERPVGDPKKINEEFDTAENIEENDENSSDKKDSVTSRGGHDDPYALEESNIEKSSSHESFNFKQDPKEETEFVKGKDEYLNNSEKMKDAEIAIPEILDSKDYLLQNTQSILGAIEEEEKERNTEKVFDEINKKDEIRNLDESRDKSDDLLNTSKKTDQKLDSTPERDSHLSKTLKNDLIGCEKSENQDNFDYEKQNEGKYYQSSEYSSKSNKNSPRSKVYESKSIFECTSPRDTINGSKNIYFATGKPTPYYSPQNKKSDSTSIDIYNKVKFI